MLRCLSNINGDHDRDELLRWWERACVTKITGCDSILGKQLTQNTFVGGPVRGRLSVGLTHVMLVWLRCISLPAYIACLAIFGKHGMFDITETERFNYVSSITSDIVDNLLLTQFWFYVGSASETVGRHRTSIGITSLVDGKVHWGLDPVTPLVGEHRYNFKHIPVP